MTDLTAEPLASIDRDGAPEAELPWGDCKVAFDLEEPEALWAADKSGALRLPTGWSLCETDGAGARWVCVFRVEGVVPSRSSGRAVLAECIRVGALPATYARP